MGRIITGDKMIGIYKITNKINNKIYIGQSIDIKRRWRAYKNPYKDRKHNSLILDAIEKYGIDNFLFEVIEECEKEQLNEKERYWIQFYDSNHIGYNLTAGGDNNVGEGNPKAQLTEADVIFIRDLYASKTTLKTKQIYEKYFQEKCGLRAFEKVWHGETWTYLHMDVYTDENKHFYNTTGKSMPGSQNGFAAFTDEEVILIRQRYVNETGTQIYEDYKDRVSYSALERLLLGTTYTNLPIYHKKSKTWSNN